jgi:hypothetical protein
MYDQRQLFDFMLDRVNEVGTESGLKQPQAFGKWFAQTYFTNPQEFFCSDSSGDGKVDCFFQVSDGKAVQHYVLNTKFTHQYGASAPVSFYDEITRFWQAFANKSNRPRYLSVVSPQLRPRYQKLFSHYDDDRAHLFFVTNHRRNEKQYEAVKAVGVQILHLDEMLQFVVDYIEDAMPRTPTLRLTGISSVLSADKRDTKVPTSIVFAKLIDLIRYMEDDPYDLLFARNIRLVLRGSKVNPEIKRTFREEPAEFAFSNNGIAMLCEGHSHDPGRQELKIENPRVVNGSQTLHSIRDVPNPSPNARVMIRVIQVPPPSPADFSNEAARRREVIQKISIRSNLQNPIKKWNLISNDNYQHDLARFFRKKKLYYERRDGEWSQRRAELVSVGIRRGPGIKFLTQLIASYHWDKKQLGPAIAKGTVGELFEEAPYQLIRRTPPDLAYQLYLLSEILDECMNELAASKRYIDELASYVWLALFALSAKAVQACGAKFGEAEFAILLEKGAYPKHRWLKFCKAGVDTIRAAYKKDAKRYRTKEGKELTLANFSKAQEYVGKLLKKPLPAQLRRLARKLVRSR